MNGYVYGSAHRIIAEFVLGKPLPPGAVVHHVNGDRADNRRGNLVICQDADYHRLLHARQRQADGIDPPTPGPTTTIAVRVSQADSNAIRRLARHEGVYISTILDRYGVQDAVLAADALDPDK